MTTTATTGAMMPAAELLLRATALTAVALLLLPAGSTAAASSTSTAGEQPGRLSTTTVHGTSVRLDSISEPRPDAPPQPASAQDADGESETFEVTLRTIGRDGERSSLSWTAYPRAGGMAEGGVFLDGTGTVRLPAGDYAIEAVVGLDHGFVGDKGASLLVQPMFTVEDDTDWTADARIAEGIEMELTGDVPATAELATTQVGYRLVSDVFVVGASLTANDSSSLFSAQIGPNAPGDEALAFVASGWGERGADGGFRRTPYFYGAVDHRPGELFTGHRSTVAVDSMAEIDTTVNAWAPDHTADWQLEYLTPGLHVPEMLSFDIAPPVRTRLHLSTRDIQWGQQIVERSTLEDGDGPRSDPTESGRPGVAVQWSDPNMREYEPGRRYVQRWGTAVFGPRQPGGLQIGSRIDDLLVFSVPMYSDADDHLGSVRAIKGSTRLLRDGEQVAASDQPGELVAPDQPDDRSAYRLETTLIADPDATTLSTEQTVAWEFASESPRDGHEVLPLWTASIEPAVDAHNVSRHRLISLVPLRLQPARSDRIGTMRTPRVEVSLDRGRTWRSVPVVPDSHDDRPGWRIVLITPRPTAGAESTVSLRVRATDSVGNSLEQTILDAYRLG